MKQYKNPTAEEVRDALAHDCAKSGHTEEACDLACPWCGEVIGCDGYCDDVDCPNYKGGKFAEFLATDETATTEWYARLDEACDDLNQVAEFLAEAPAEARAKFADAVSRIRTVANEECEVHN